MMGIKMDIWVIIVNEPAATLGLPEYPIDDGVLTCTPHAGNAIDQRFH